MPVNPVATAAMAGPATIGATPTTAGPLGGFEALLATLFGGQAEGATGMANPFQVSDADATKDEAPSGDATNADANVAAQSLLAAFVAPTATPIVAQPVAGSETAGATPDPATVPAVNLPAAAPQTPPGEPQASNGATPPTTPGATQAVTPKPGQADIAPMAPAPPSSTPAPQPAVDATTPAAPAPAQLAAATAPPLATTLPPQAAAPSPQSKAPPPVSNPTVEVADGEVQSPGAAKPGVSAAKPTKAATVGPDAGLDKVDAADPAPAQAADAETSPDASSSRAPDAPAPAVSSSQAPVAHAPALRGAPETVATLAAQILKKLDSRTTRFDMELEPLGLGKVDVRLEIGAHGRLTAAMAFENPHSAQELRNRAGELSRALEQAGFDVTDGLSFDVADNPGGSNQNSGGQDQTRDAPSRGRAFMAALQNASGADAPPLVHRTYARLRASGVDIKI